MDDESYKDMEEFPNGELGGKVFNVRNVLQSIWVRCRSIFPNTTDRKFMEGELRFVLYSGVIFWTLYLVYETFK